MERLLEKLKADYPDLTFVEGSFLCWSPEKKEVYFDPTSKENDLSGVLHEIGHARLGHASYQSDVDLLKKESEAWNEAVLLAKEYGFTLDKNHVQECLDTYREWVHKRSTCPRCKAKGIQVTPTHYSCLNCDNEWIVTESRFLRPYRRKTKSPRSESPGSRVDT